MLMTHQHEVQLEHPILSHPGDRSPNRPPRDGRCSLALPRYTCRGLFERHKLLFSFQMCAKILETSGNLKMDEYNFFLRGGVVSAGRRQERGSRASSGGGL